MDAAERRAKLVELYEEASGCVRCPLAETRIKVVFGAGDADADLLFVGEGPGAEEDRRGLPFVGRAGGLLEELLGGIGLSRDQVFIANTVKCRPPGNRDPHPAEIEACRPYLFGQVELIEPKVVATLGNFATKLLTGNGAGITRVRGVPQTKQLGARTVSIFPLLHPAAALRATNMRELLVEDFGRLGELLREPPPEPLEDESEASEGAAGAAPAGADRPPPGAARPERDQLDLFGG